MSKELKCPKCGSEDLEDTSVWCEKCGEWVEYAELSDAKLDVTNPPKGGSGVPSAGIPSDKWNGVMPKYSSKKFNVFVECGGCGSRLNTKLVITNADALAIIVDLCEECADDCILEEWHERKKCNE